MRAIRRSLVGAGADHFDFDAAVFGASFSGFVVSHGRLFAFAFGVNAVFLYAFAHQVSLDSFSTAHRQGLVVGVSTNGVGVADGNDHFQTDAFDFADQVVYLGAGFRLENGLIEVKERIGGVGDLGGSYF